MVSEIACSRNDARSRERSVPKRTPANSIIWANWLSTRGHLYFVIHGHQVCTLIEKGRMVWAAEFLNYLFRQLSPSLRSYAQIGETVGGALLSSNWTSVL